MPSDQRGRLKDPGPMPRLQDDGSGERHVIPDAGRCPVRQVRVGHLCRRALQQVRVRPVVEGDHPRGVGRLKVARGLPRRNHVGRGAQRLHARRERQRPILIRRIVVRDRPCSLRVQQHRLVGLRPPIRRDTGDRSGSHGLAPVDLRESGGSQLGQARRVGRRGRRGELPDRATHAHACPNRRDLTVLPHVDEEGVRARPPLIPRAATARRLNRVPIQGICQPRLTCRIRRSHDANRRHGGTHHRRVVPLPHRLNLRDWGIDGRTF